MGLTINPWTYFWEKGRTESSDTAKTVGWEKVPGASLWGVDSSQVDLHCQRQELSTGHHPNPLLLWGTVISFISQWVICPYLWVGFNLCLFSWCTSLFQSTLKMKPVPSLAAVKGVMLKISHPCSPSPDCLSVSRCWQKLFVVFPSFGEWQETGVKWENEM